MKVVYTDAALRDLDGILKSIASDYPGILELFEKRLRAVESRIGQWPESAQEVEQRPGTRAVPLIRYPYKVFYQITPKAVEILHIRHAARQDPWEGKN